MNKLSQFKKGFTLLEILIGTAIFAVVMVMTTGVIAQSTGYQSKSKALREASEEASRISDLIARDLKTAKGSFTVVDLSSTPKTVTFKNGVAMVDSSGVLQNFNPPANFNNSINLNTTATGYTSSALIINTDTKIKIYSSKAVNGQNDVFARDFDKTASDVIAVSGWLNLGSNTLNLQNSTGEPLIGYVTGSNDNIISTYTGDDALDTTAAFSGFTASDQSGTYYLQSYVNYYVHAETKDFATLPPTTRSMADIRSMVTMRNYAN